MLFQILTFFKTFFECQTVFDPDQDRHSDVTAALLFLLGDTKLNLELFANHFSKISVDKKL